jgi:hypothetical protein
MVEKIIEFLREVRLQNASRGTWGIGTMISRGGAKAAQALMPIALKTEEDSILISESNDLVLPIVKEQLRKSSYGLKDPALFDVPTATFCVYMAFQALGRIASPSLVFVTLKPVSQGATHVFIVGHALSLTTKTAAHWVKQIREVISTAFPGRVA